MKEERICKLLLRIRLKEKNMSQYEMAEEIGVTVVTYNHLENGQKTVSLKTIEKLSKYLGLSYGYIREHL